MDIESNQLGIYKQGGRRRDGPQAGGFSLRSEAISRTLEFFFEDI